MWTVRRTPLLPLPAPDVVGGPVYAAAPTTSTGLDITYVPSPSLQQSPPSPPLQPSPPPSPRLYQSSSAQSPLSQSPPSSPQQPTVPLPTTALPRPHTEPQQQRVSARTRSETVRISATPTVQPLAARETQSSPSPGEGGQAVDHSTGLLSMMGNSALVSMLNTRGAVDASRRKEPPPVGGRGQPPLYAGKNGGTPWAFAAMLATREGIDATLDDQRPLHRPRDLPHCYASDLKVPKRHKRAMLSNMHIFMGTRRGGSSMDYWMRGRSGRSSNHWTTLFLRSGFAIGRPTNTVGARRPSGDLKRGGISRELTLILENCLHPMLLFRVFGYEQRWRANWALACATLTLSRPLSNLICGRTSTCVCPRVVVGCLGR